MIGFDQEPPKPSHTATPWEIHKHNHVDDQLWLSIGYKGRGPICHIVGEKPSPITYQPVAEIRFLVTPEKEQIANAEHIVKCVNSHDALVRACKDLKKDLENNGEILQTDQKRVELLESALALAGEAI